MAAKNSNGSTNEPPEPSLLLALPVELLQRITNELSEETLTAFRLTSKTSEAATFDRFAKIFFEERHCYIYEKPRWTLLDSIVSSRLADRVRKVVFTTDFLAPVCTEQLQLAPEHARIGAYEHQWAQIELKESMSCAVGPRQQIPAWPSTGAIERCLINVRNLAPKLHVELNLGGYYGWSEQEEECTSVQASILFALAASRMKLTTFSIAQPGLGDFDETMKTQGCELSAPMRSLQNFSYSEPIFAWNEYDRSLISGLLRSAIKLRKLKLSLDPDDFLFYSNYDPVIPGLFRGNDFTHLETLEIEYMNVNGVDLVAALLQCRRNLRRVHIEDVCVTESDNERFRVLGIFTEMPSLSSVSLVRLAVVGQYHMVFNDLKHGDTYNGYQMRYEGHLEVAAGLKELLDARLTGSYWRDPF
jgi:hypothetical protein